MTVSASPTDISTLVHAVAQRLINARARLVTAESCTGGLIAAACTEVSGSSVWFDHGVISYSNRAKTELLGVPESLIAEFGAVSAEVAQAMAAGLLLRSGADYAIAVSGIAGPTGGSSFKPVGTVFIAVGTVQQVRPVYYQFYGDRASVRQQATYAALQQLLDQI